MLAQILWYFEFDNKKKIIGTENETLDGYIKSWECENWGASFGAVYILH